MRSTAGAIERPQNADGTLAVQRELVVASLWTILGLAVAFAALLITRRISGAFHQPLSGAAIVLAGLVTELSIFAYRQLWSGRGRQAVASQYSVLRSLSDAQPSPLVFILTTLFALSILIALTIPGTPLLALLLAWLIVLVCEAAQLHSHFRPNWGSTSPVPLIPTPPPLPSEVKIAPTGTEPTETAATEPEIPAGLIQQVTRVVEDNQESIHALIKATIAANDRLAVVHLAFCPPLSKTPELTAHTLDTEEADVRITQAETFGARLEIRLPKVNPAEQSVMIELLGSVTHMGRASSRP